jgi:MOSC domain-containing protein YiiM
MPGTVTHLFLKPKHGEPVRPVASAQAISGKGLQHDINFGRRKRQVLMIERETLDEFGLPPGDVRENVTVEGIPLAGLPAGTLVRVGEVLFEATMDCAPCEFIERKRPGLQAAMEGRRGTLFRVVQAGQIKVGDPISVLVPDPAG